LIIRQYLKPDSPKVTSREPDAGHIGRTADHTLTLSFASGAVAVLDYLGGPASVSISAPGLQL